MLNIEYKLPPKAEECSTNVSAYDVVRWQEMLAVLHRLGVVMDRPYSRVVIDLDFQNGDANVHLEQLACDAEAVRTVDTTNCHNDRWKTCIPNHVRES